MSPSAAPTAPRASTRSSSTARTTVARGPVEIPRAAVRQVVAERDRIELLRDPDVLEAGVVAVREREVDQPVGAGEGHGRLGARACQQFQAAARATSEHENEGANAGHPLVATRRAAEYSRRRQR